MQGTMVVNGVASKKMVASLTHTISLVELVRVQDGTRKMESSSAFTVIKIDSLKTPKALEPELFLEWELKNTKHYGDVHRNFNIA